MRQLPAVTRRHLLSIVLALVVGIVGGIWLAPGGGDGSVDASARSDAEVWTCSMHPQVRASAPGQCPLCGMDLIPATTENADDDGVVVLSERARTLARLRTTEVVPMAEDGGMLRLLGRLEAAESERRTVTSWISGRVDRLTVTTTGTRVRRGQVVARLYSPEVYAAHQDLLTALQQAERLADAPDASRLAARAALSAARERLRLLGVPARELSELETADAPTRSVPIRSPHSGTVLTRQVTQGQYVQTGTPLFEVARLDPLWVQLDAYEADLGRLSVGQRVRLVVAALPGAQVEGRVAFIEPTVDPVRRTARVRVEVDNPAGSLRPGLFVEAVVEVAVPESDVPLVIPTSAALYTGRRSVVYVEQQTATGIAYRPRAVQLGPELGGVYPVLAGLERGEKVVSRGAFVLDADLQIRGGPSMMSLPDDAERAARQAHQVQLSPHERHALAPVLTHYLQLQAALASDDLEGARQAAARLGPAAASVQLPAAAVEAWAPLAAALQVDAGLIGQAVSLDAARERLSALSATVQATLSRFGNPLDEPVHLAFCPMARGNQGGHWLQRGESIDNAYYGAAMRSCGELQASAAPGAHLDAPLPAPSAAPHGAVH